MTETTTPGVTSRSHRLGSGQAGFLIATVIIVIGIRWFRWEVA